MLKNSEGQRVPEVTFRTRTAEGQWKDVPTREVFAGRNVAEREGEADHRGRGWIEEVDVLDHLVAQAAL